MHHICSQCNICAFMPEQTAPRLLSFNNTENPAFDTMVLVIDDSQNQLDQYDGMKWVADNLLPNTPFTYTSTVRCEYDPIDLEAGQFEQALEQCAVWTHQLLEGRAVIITTENGLHQMQVGQDKKRGDMFKHPRLGSILVIPPVAVMMHGSFVKEYLPRVQRVLKEVNLV